MSELDSINIMLGVIGESPVNSVDVGLAPVAIAKQMLYNESRFVQTRGWDFNSEKNYPILLTSEGFLNLPPNTLKSDLTDTYSYKYDVVTRGFRVYNRGDHTYTFTESLTYDLVLFLPLTDLPQAAKDFITIRAARKFQRRLLGSDTLEAITRDEEMAAKVMLENTDSDQADYNMMDSVDTALIMAR